MSGLYLHIPFCASRCIYCDFYSTTLRGRSHDYVDAMIREMEERPLLSSPKDWSLLSSTNNQPKGDWLQEDNKPLKTIYLGGGTPSQLEPEDLSRLLAGICSHYDTKQVEELTIEANPEDITEAWVIYLVEAVKKLGLPLPRISMGVQTMVDAELKILNRRHTAERVKDAMAILRRAGIYNISLDLMYGLPQQTMESWQYSIEQLLLLEPKHISAYNLQIEEGTRLQAMLQSKEISVPDEETCVAMNNLLRCLLRDTGFEQYEISNYALPNFHSRHNSSYWDGTPYLGLGPGAHSYDGQRLRSWNAPDVRRYIAGNREERHEILSDVDLYNERIMLGLRTKKGVSLLPPLSKGNEKTSSLPDMSEVVQNLINRNLLCKKDGYLVLTEDGLPLADEVMRELFIIEDEDTLQ